MEQPKPTRQRPRSMDVEVLATEDLWAKYGPKLPEPSKQAGRGFLAYQPRRWFNAGAGFILSVLLHALIFAPMLLGTAGRPKRAPMAEGAAASGETSRANEVLTMVLLLNSDAISAQEEPDESIYEVVSKLDQQLKQDLVLVTDLPKPSEPDLGGAMDGTDELSPTAEATGDAAGRAMLFGRYMGQIKARITRAWDYPPTAMSPTFQCKVQIRQDRQGNVQEVTFQRCGDDSAWQLSLAQAVQRASPLSAPPEESVFTEVLTLSFEAQAPVQLAGNQAVSATTTDSLSATSISTDTPVAQPVSTTTAVTTPRVDLTSGPGVQWARDDKTGNLRLTITGSGTRDYSNLPALAQPLDQGDGTHESVISAPGRPPELPTAPGTDGM